MMKPGDLDGKLSRLIKLFETPPSTAEIGYGWNEATKSEAASHLEQLREVIAQGTIPPEGDIVRDLSNKGATGPLLALIADVLERIPGRRI